MASFVGATGTCRQGALLGDLKAEVTSFDDGRIRNKLH